MCLLNEGSQLFVIGVDQLERKKISAEDEENTEINTEIAEE